MAYTQEDLDNINEAIATGAKTVEIQGRKVEYRSLEEMIAIKKLISDEVNPPAPSSDGSSVNKVTPTFSKEEK